MKRHSLLSKRSSRRISRLYHILHCCQTPNDEHKCKREIVAEAQADKATMRQLADQNKQEVVEENKKKIEKVHEIQEGIHEAKNKLLQDNIRLGK